MFHNLAEKALCTQNGLLFRNVQTFFFQKHFSMLENTYSYEQRQIRITTITFKLYRSDRQTA